MAKLIFEHLNEEVEIADGSEIKDVCEEKGLCFACSEGVCGSCTVEVIEGMENLTEFTQEEEDFFGDKEEERLACMCKIKSGTVKIKF